MYRLLKCKRPPKPGFHAGFTLIELLVVVLIIGVLAAAALPQYKLSVCKARMAQVETTNRQIYDATRAYLMANGKVAQSFEELGFHLPGFTRRTIDNGNEMLTDGEYEFMLDAGGGVARIDGSYKSGLCWAVLYTYATPAHHDPRPGHCLSYNQTGHKYCLSRWPGSTCRPGEGGQMVCTIKK